MVNFDATTPQSKAAKGLFDALAALDLNKARPVLSKDYLFKSFPKSAELPDLTKEEYIQKYNAILVLLAQVEFVFYEVIEAPGKVVTHFTILFTTSDGIVIDYDSLLIISFVDEDGATKVLEAKDFSDPEKRKRFYVEAAKILAKGIPVA